MKIEDEASDWLITRNEICFYVHEITQRYEGKRGYSVEVHTSEQSCTLKSFILEEELEQPGQTETEPFYVKEDEQPEQPVDNTEEKLKVLKQKARAWLKDYMEKLEED